MTDSIQAFGDLYLEKNFTDEKAYSYYGGALGAGLSFSLFETFGFWPYASIGRRIYESEDPFFRETRRDTRQTAGLRVHKEDVRFFGFMPELEVRYDENRSNLSYYSYDKLTVQMNFIE
jgi:hypothetical protein